MVTWFCKCMLAQDETLEIGNQFFAAFPMIRELKSFVCQGSYVGMCQMCKQFFRLFYTTTRKAVLAIQRGSTECNMSPEQTLIYEIIRIFLGHNLRNPRIFNEKTMNISKLKKKVKTKVKRSKLENNMKATEEDNATKLLNGVHHLWDECVVVRDDASNENVDADNYEDLSLAEGRLRKLIKMVHVDCTKHLVRIAKLSNLIRRE